MLAYPGRLALITCQRIAHQEGLFNCAKRLHAMQLAAIRVDHLDL
jgi:hypothetical protein